MFSALVGILFLGAAQLPRVDLNLSAYHTTESKVEAAIQTRDVKTVYLDLYRVTPMEFMSSFSPKGTFVKSTPIVMPDPQRLPPNGQPVYRSRTFTIDFAKPGLYEVRARGGKEGQWRHKINVTRLSTVLKRSFGRTLFWVTSANTGQTLGNVGVTLYDAKFQKQTGGTTKPDGTCLMNWTGEQAWIVANRGDDYAITQTYSQNPDGRLMAHWITDRPIYRPGHKISFRTALRYTKGSAYSVKPNEKVKVTFRDPKDTVLDILDLTTTETGLVSGEVKVPLEGSLGGHTFVLETKGGASSYYSVQVQAYRKPEYKVTIQPSKPRILAGETFQFVVSAQTYFDAPVGQSQVQVVVRRNPIYGHYEESYGIDDGTRFNPSYSGEFIMNSVFYTGDDGKAVIDIPTKVDLMDASYSIEATVVDASRRVVRSVSSATVYSSTLRPLITSDLRCAPLRSLVPVTVTLKDWDGKPAAGNVSIWVTGHSYDRKLGHMVEDKTPPVTWKVGPNGVLKANAPVAFEGLINIVVESTDSGGRKSRDNTAVYAVGAFEEAESARDDSPMLMVTTTKSAFDMGEAITGYAITSDQPGRKRGKKAAPASPILVTWEGQDILSYQVITKGKNAKVTLPTQESYGSSVVLAAAQWVNNEETSSHMTVPLIMKSKKISVKLETSAKEIEPGDKLTLKVTAKDSKGQPLSGDITLALVDEAIYAISPDQTLDAFKLYWGIRNNWVNTQRTAPKRKAAGAFQPMDAKAESAPGGEGEGIRVRSRFEDTAFWKGVVHIDANGETTVTIPMPDNLTTWRTIAYAIDPTTKVGSATTSILATKPVTLRLATPRVIVEGDNLDLIATVNNRTDEDRTFVVQLKLNGQNPAQQVAVKAKGSGTLHFPITAPEGQSSLDLEAVTFPEGLAPKNMGDALRLSVPIVPEGLPYRVVSGHWTDTRPMTVDVNFPEIAVPRTTRVKVTAMAGIPGIVRGAAVEIARHRPYCTQSALARLKAAVLLGKTEFSDEVREAIAYLNRTVTYEGWGWWDRSPADPTITAGVLQTLLEVQRMGLPIPQNLLSMAKNANQNNFQAEKFWERRAFRDSTQALADDAHTGRAIETAEKGVGVSPAGRLRLAQTLILKGRKDLATQLAKKLANEVSVGGSVTYLPVGHGIGWTKSEVYSNALLLRILLQLDMSQNLWPGLANWLINAKGSVWGEDQVEVLLALNDYAAKTGEKDGPIPVLRFTLNGKTYETKSLPSGEMSVTVDSTAKPGANRLEFAAPNSPARWMVEASCVARTTQENSSGIRVVRRFEVQNSSGAWVETTKDIPVGTPVRCTTVLWADSTPDLMRIVQPIPAGFEVIDEDYTDWYANKEVRDDAVSHYVYSSGWPITLRHFIRSESTGSIHALPAFAELVRRAGEKGNSSALTFKVFEQRP